MVLAFSQVAIAASYTTHVYFSTPSLQADFIANTTNSYQGTLVKSPYFPNTYSFTATGKKPSTVTGSCDVDKQIALMVANSTKTYDYGFAAGMEEERKQTLATVHNLKYKDATTESCAGTDIYYWTFKDQCSQGIFVSSDYMVAICSQVYDTVVSTITQRNGMLFTPTGAIVDR